MATDTADDRFQETTIRSYRDTARILSQAAKCRDLSIPDFIEKHLRPAILREYRAALEQATAELNATVGNDDRD